MELIVGRKGQQRTPITDPSVSREHCRLTSNPDGTFTLENLSANGTYVDGKSIIRTVVTADTQITLGTGYTVRVGDLLPAASRTAESGKQPEDTDARYREQFRRLKQVYDQYSNQKIALQREATLKNFYRSLPSAVMTVLFAVSMLGGDSTLLAQIRPAAGVLTLLLIALTTYQVYNGQKDLPAKMEALNKQFMIDYVCPKCGNFLGFVPFESLENKKQCNFCKCKWV